MSKKQDQIDILAKVVYLMASYGQKGEEFQFNSAYFTICYMSGRDDEWMELCNKFLNRVLKDSEVEDE